jgi:hypothetical protein
MRKQRLLIALLAVVASGALGTLVVLLATGGEAGPPGDAPSLTGTVTNVTTNGSFGSVLVEEVPGQQVGSKVVLTVTGNTRIFTGKGNGSKAVNFALLHAGQRVEVWYAGPALLSYPEQADVRTIVILSG